MFVDGIGFRKIILCTKRVDMRRGVDGLSAYVMLNYHLDPTDRGVLYLFRGRSARTIKGICFEGIGTVLYTLRLAPGNSFLYPRNADEARSLSPEQYRQLMSGIALDGTIRDPYFRLTGGYRYATILLRTDKQLSGGLTWVPFI